MYIPKTIRNTILCMCIVVCGLYAVTLSIANYLYKDVIVQEIAWSDLQCTKPMQLYSAIRTISQKPASLASQLLEKNPQSLLAIPQMAGDRNVKPANRHLVGIECEKESSVEWVPAAVFVGGGLIHPCDSYIQRLQRCLAMKVNQMILASDKYHNVFGCQMTTSTYCKAMVNFLD
jgi:hypothetical protein